MFPGKIGKPDAERDYYNKVVPTIESRPDLFPPEHLNRWYTLERYHVMGSRILSRSFQVEKWDHPAGDEEEDGVPQGEMSADDGLDPLETGEGNNDEVDENPGDCDGEGDDDSGDVAMVPMADMLNARFGCNNVRCLGGVFAHI